MKTIKIPNSLIEVLSYDLKLRRLVVFYYHFESFGIFPTQTIKAANFKLLSKEINVSIRTILNQLKYLRERNLLTENKGFYWLKHTNDLYNEIRNGCIKKSFTEIRYQPKYLEMQLQALPIYLNAKKQEYTINKKIGYQYEFKIGSPEFIAMKKYLFTALLKSPYNYRDPKVAPIITLEKAAKLIGKSSDSTAFHLFKKLNATKLLITHKIPKPVRIKSKVRNSKYNFIREPPNIVLFKKW